MSGTSCDGIDAALIRVSGRGEAMSVRFVGHLHRAYPAALRRRLLSIMAPSATRTEELCALHALVGEFFAATASHAVRELAGARRVAVVGSHGQTICHLPPGRGGSSKRDRVVTGSTLQIGDAARIAAAVRVPVVADFRQADVAVGGQGAPLVPWTDFVLFGDRRMSRAVQNIGGIANVTFLPAGGASRDVVAFDTGPGNMVIDELARRFSDGRRQFDAHGRGAARGRVLEPVLKHCLADRYFRRSPPKSAGREQFGRSYVDALLARFASLAASPADWLATATSLTATTIARAYDRFLPHPPGAPAVQEMIVCGGGARNRTLLSLLAEQLPGVRVRVIDEFGVPDSAKEAASFAMLALACVDGVPANLPQVTGASRPIILGSITSTPA